jgi:hypothetical protein
LDTDDISLSEEEIKMIRKKSGKPLLVIIPMNPKKYNGISDNEPIIGIGVMFPIIEGEKKYEYAARPLTADFEEEVQQSDDEDDDEN